MDYTPTDPSRQPLSRQPNTASAFAAASGGRFVREQRSGDLVPDLYPGDHLSGAGALQPEPVRALSRHPVHSSFTVVAFAIHLVLGFIPIIGWLISTSAVSGLSGVLGYLHYEGGQGRVVQAAVYRGLSRLARQES